MFALHLTRVDVCLLILRTQEGLVKSELLTFLKATDRQILLSWFVEVDLTDFIGIFLPDDVLFDVGYL